MLILSILLILSYFLVSYIIYNQRIILNLRLDFWGSPDTYAKGPRGQEKDTSGVSGCERMGDRLAHQADINLGMMIAENRGSCDNVMCARQNEPPDIAEVNAAVDRD